MLMVVSLLALSTVPCQLASPHASGTLLTVGMLYLCTRRATGRVMPLYLGSMRSVKSFSGVSVFCVRIWRSGSNDGHVFNCAPPHREDVIDLTASPGLFVYVTSPSFGQTEQMFRNRHSKPRQNILYTSG